MLLLDSDHLSIIQRRTLPEFNHIEQRRAQHAPSDFFVPVISFHEQVLGWNAYLQRAKSPQGVTHAYGMFERILADFSTMQVASFDVAAADCFLDLRRKRIRIGTMDLRIAAIAISRDFTLL
ncbi:MAG: type II toxin-antitoxin system VapC family toxin [Planctomycetes bacterium]|nr:type II toxin-antitoxin system VapC family toxin [Planctomycetota bacterium]